MRRNSTVLHIRQRETEMSVISNEHGCTKRFAFVSVGSEVQVLLLQRSKNKRIRAALKIPAFWDVMSCKHVTTYQWLWSSIPKDLNLQ